MVPNRKCAGIGCKLREHIRCSEMPAADVARLESTMVVRAVARDEKIFSQGADSTGLYCLRSGHALLWHADAYNHKTAFRVVGPGEMMGYRSLFGEDTHAANAQALTACDVCYYPKKILLQLVDEFSGFARRFFRILARDRGPRDALLLRGQHIPVRTRLVNLLLLMNTDELYPNNGTCVLRLPMLRRDIAALLAARPESIARAIKELGQDGIAVFTGRTVTIPSLDALHAETNREQLPLNNSVTV
jgi:CRP/FNR family transcriptional regulator